MYLVKCYRDALIISFMDTFTSLLAGITTFSVIGNLMKTTGQSFEQVQDKISGPGLAFILVSVSTLIFIKQHACLMAFNGVYVYVSIGQLVPTSYSDLWWSPSAIRGSFLPYVIYAGDWFSDLVNGWSHHYNLRCIV